MPRTNHQPSKPPKPPKQSPRGRVYPPPTPSQTPRLTRLLFFLAPPWPSWPLKIHWKNEYILLLGPFGSDTRRYDMHYKCHSTSICRFGGPFFTFRPLTSIFFMKFDPEVPPIRDLETQKRPNTEPQGVPEALETLIR